MTRVHLPTHLRSYTAGAPEIEVSGRTLGDVFDALEARCPGIRVRIVDEQDRIRPHVKAYIGGEQAWSLGDEVGGQDVHLLAALSGG